MTQKQTIAALKRIKKQWPKGLWLFAAGNTLHLMREHQDGSRHCATGGMDPKLIVSSFKIPCDGGDW